MLLPFYTPECILRPCAFSLNCPCTAVFTLFWYLTHFDMYRSYSILSRFLFLKTFLRFKLHGVMTHSMQSSFENSNYQDVLSHRTKYLIILLCSYTCKRLYLDHKNCRILSRPLQLQSAYSSNCRTPCSGTMRIYVILAVIHGKARRASNQDRMLRAIGTLICTMWLPITDVFKFLMF